MTVTEAAQLAVLMNTRRLMEIVVLDVGLSEGILDPRLYAILLAMTVVSTTMTAPLLTLVARPTPAIGRHASAAALRG